MVYITAFYGLRKDSLLNSESFKTGAKSHFAADIGSEQRQLRDAAYGGRADEIKKLVSSGMVDLNYCGGGVWGSTPLCTATKNDRKSTVKALLGGDSIEKNSA